MKRLVIGCGFLGLPLAKRWLEAGNEVFATTRHTHRAEQFSAIGLNSIVLDTTEPDTVSQLADHTFDTVVVAVGMDRTRYDSVHQVYVEGLRNVLENLHENTGQVIYISSTGVFGDFDGAWVDESSPTDPLRDGGKACLAAEQLLQASRFADRATILRMAGLYGDERVPTKETVASKQWSKLSPQGYLNLIHLDDAVSATCVAADQRLHRELFLIADSNPTLRGEYYQHIADQFQLGPIPWSDNASNPNPNARGAASKRISNKKFLQRTGMVLKHPDFRSGLAIN